jgi:retinoic acid receptor gamma
VPKPGRVRVRTEGQTLTDLGCLVIRMKIVIYVSFPLSLSRILGNPLDRPGRVGTEPPRPGQWAWAGAVAEDHPRLLQSPRDSHAAATMATNKERLFAPGALGPGSGYPGAGFPFAFPGALRGSPPFEMLSPSFRGLGQPDLPKEMASLCESQGSWGGNEGRWVGCDLENGHPCWKGGQR